jgi:hypothetical protein
MGALSTTINEKQCLNYILHNPDSILELTQNFFLTGEGYDLYESCGILKFLVQPDRINQGGTNGVSKNYNGRAGGNISPAL